MERLTNNGILSAPGANKDIENKTVIFSREGERRFIIMHGAQVNLKVPFRICVLDHSKGSIKILTENNGRIETLIKGTDYLEFTPPYPVLTRK